MDIEITKSYFSHQVSLESCPNEVFIHVSAIRCWELVRDRVNQEITKQHKLGRKGLPPLQPPGSLDGFAMFGFSSPAIVQVILLIKTHLQFKVLHVSMTWAERKSYSNSCFYPPSMNKYIVFKFTTEFFFSTFVTNVTLILRLNYMFFVVIRI